MPKVLKKHVQIQKWNNFCGMVAFFLTFSLSSYSQVADYLSFRKLSPSATSLSFWPILTNTRSFCSPQKQIFLHTGSPFAHWGFMCIGEYRFEKKTGIPLRLRLGSLEHVNRLEGKK
jgi:hypothetical protein